MPLELDDMERTAVRTGDVNWAQAIRNFLDENPNVEPGDLIDVIWEMIEPVTVDQVGKRAREFGVSPPIADVLDQHRDEFCRLYLEGVTLAKIASRFRVPISSVALTASALRSQGVDLPQRCRPMYPQADKPSL